MFLFCTELKIKINRDQNKQYQWIGDVDQSLIDSKRLVVEDVAVSSLSFLSELLTCDQFMAEQIVRQFTIN